MKRREDWFEGQLDLEPDRLVFIDETWASTNMGRKRGRGPRGERLRMSVPHGHWKTTTFVRSQPRHGQLRCGRRQGAGTARTALGVDGVEASQARASTRRDEAREAMMRNLEAARYTGVSQSRAQRL